MSALTSFDALHEPQSEDPPENVLSKIFQRVKSTLSTSHTSPTPTPPPSTATTTGVLPYSSSSDRVNATSASSSSTTLHAGSTVDAHLTTSLTSAGGNSNINNGNNQLATVGQSQNSNNGSEQYLSRVHDKVSSSTSSSASTTGTSETGSWVVTSDSAASSNNTINNNGSTKTAPTNSSNNKTTARHSVVSTIGNSKDRASVVRRSYPAAASSTAPKRASSLFKVSTLDDSIIQDDDAASLSSLAPPVVSLSPAMEDPPESVGAVMIRPIDSRIVDHTRLSAGTFSAFCQQYIVLHCTMVGCRDLVCNRESEKVIRLQPYRCRAIYCSVSLWPILTCIFTYIGDNSTTRDYIHQTLGAKDASYDSDARSIRSFSSGHQKGNSLTKVIRRLRGEGVNKDYWMADENAKECFGCSASFFVFRRKHHCRICGK